MIHRGIHRLDWYWSNWRYASDLIVSTRIVSWNYEHHASTSEWIPPLLMLKRRRSPDWSCVCRCRVWWWIWLWLEAVGTRASRKLSFDRLMKPFILLTKALVLVNNSCFIVVVVSADQPMACRGELAESGWIFFNCQRFLFSFCSTKKFTRPNLFLARCQ